MNVVELQGVVKKFGGMTAVSGISFVVAEGQCVALLGPSGCGKTTTLKMIVGFENPDEGEIFISGKNMRGIPPYRRSAGLVFQDYALFPHMSVEQNISYGMRHRGIEPRQIPERTKRILSLVKLSGYEKRRPGQLSGGEQQRVALARSLVTEPTVMLLDEPLSNLDAKLRQELRLELNEILSSLGTTTILVTHDQEEAMSLADHVVLMNRGRVVQQGRPTEIYAAPQTKFAAEFIGRSNWFAGAPDGEPSGGVQAYRTSEGMRLLVKPPKGTPTGGWEVGVRPERMRIDRGLDDRPVPPSVRRNEITGVVDQVENLGSDLYIWVKLPSGRRIQAVEKNLNQSAEAPGATIKLWFEIEDCLVVTSDTAQ